MPSPPTTAMLCVLPGSLTCPESLHEKTAHHVRGRLQRTPEGGVRSHNDDYRAEDARGAEIAVHGTCRIAQKSHPCQTRRVERRHGECTHVLGYPARA